VEWKDGFTLYEKLPDIKEALPIRIAEYTICMEGTLCFEKEEEDSSSSKQSVDQE